MFNYSNILIAYLILAIIGSSCFNIYLWRYSQNQGSRAYFFAYTTSIVWMFGDVIIRLSESFEILWIGLSIAYLGALILPVAMVQFIFKYLGKSISTRYIGFLSVIPISLWVLMLTNHWHFSFFVNEDTSKFGVAYWFVFIPYSYILILLGFSSLLMEISSVSRNYRKQILFLFFATWIPVIANIIQITGIAGKEFTTPLSFPIFFSLVAFAVYRYELLGYFPIAYETVFRINRDGVLILDQNDLIRDINPAAAKGLGKKPQDIIGFHVREAFSAWQSARDLYDSKPVELGEIEVSLFGTTLYLLIDSTPLNITSKKSEGRIITIRDNTDRHKHQLSLEALAFHDPLTRLANRRKFQEEVERAIEKAKKCHESLAILYFDLNGFKEVNDRYGHEIGDKFLEYIAARISSILRNPDIAARFGGDEFALLLHDCDEEGIELVIKRMLENVKRPFKVDEHVLVADMSIGVAFYPQHGKNLTELLRHADTAMYEAKQSGNCLTTLDLRPNLFTDLEM
jgi:diguanylate cyclase (GGDEF)-like protein